MPASGRPISPTSELIVRVMRIVRTCPEATSDVLELILLVGQIEALAKVDHGYRQARRVVSRLRQPLWDLTPEQREALARAADALQAACKLKNEDIPLDAFDGAETEDVRGRVERGLADTLSGEFTNAQIVRVTGAVTAILQL